MPETLELWIKTDTGFWLVTDLKGYDLQKPMARAAIIEELQSCISENHDA